MTAAVPAAPALPARRGRPPAIDRDAIADAVLAIGIDRASMRAVAAHLGVSVPGLYHHVGNHKELLLLAAERSLARQALPADVGQHWSEWLREWARYSRTAFVEDPGVCSQYLSGATSWERVVEVTDSVIRVLARWGFSPAEAMAAWEAVGHCALGSAVDTIRQQRSAAAGRPELAEWHRVLAQRGPGELAGARAAVDHLPDDCEAEFEEALTTLLVGLAVRRGESWEDVVRPAP